MRRGEFTPSLLNHDEQLERIVFPFLPSSRACGSRSAQQLVTKAGPCGGFIGVMTKSADLWRGAVGLPPHSVHTMHADLPALLYAPAAVGGALAGMNRATLLTSEQKAVLAAEAAEKMQAGARKRERQEEAAAQEAAADTAIQGLAIMVLEQARAEVELEGRGRVPERLCGRVPEPRVAPRVGS